MILKIERWR